MVNLNESDTNQNIFDMSMNTGDNQTFFQYKVNTSDIYPLTPYRLECTVAGADNLTIVS